MQYIYCKKLNKVYNKGKSGNNVGGRCKVNIFKRTKKITDERIETVRNQIYKEIYYVVMVICFVSVLVKHYKYGAGMEMIYTEFFIMLVGGLYYIARSSFLGVLWDEIEMHDRTSKTPMSTKTVVTCIGLAIGISIIMGVNSAVSYADSSSQGLEYFAVTSLASVIFYLPILLLIYGGIYLLAKNLRR